MAYSNARRTLASTLTRVLSSSSYGSASRSRTRFAFALSSAKQTLPVPYSFPVRLKSSGSGYSPLNDPSPNWSNRPPKETILLDGCDYEHWLIVMEFPDNPKPSEDEMVNSYVKTLAQVLGRFHCFRFFVSYLVSTLLFYFVFFQFLIWILVVVRKRPRRRYTLFLLLHIQVSVLLFRKSFLINSKVIYFVLF